VLAVFRSLRHRNYRLFFAGQSISLIGTWMQSVAQSWLVYQLTGSTVLLGTVGFCGQIPVFLLGPVTGAVADRHDRRRIVIATQSSSAILAAVLAVLTFTGWVRTWHIIVLASLLGLVNAFDIPARQSFVPELVPREDLSNAIALNSSMFNGARVVGPAIAGILVAAVGEAWCFLGNAVSYVAVIVSLTLIRPPERRRTAPTASALEHIFEGFDFIRRTRPIRLILLLLGVMSLVGMPYTVLMPVFAAQILGGGASTLGSLMASTGVGALTGALLLARRKGFRGMGRLIGIAAMGFGISLILFAASRNLHLSMILLFPVGFSMISQMAASNTLIQAMVPDHLRGRVMSVYSMMFMGMAPFGSLIAGTAAKAVGAPAVVMLGGVVAVVAGAVFIWRLPVFRGEARRLIVAQQVMPGEPSPAPLRQG
jgi:MFS family permease